MKGRDPVGMRVSVQAMDLGGPKPVVREIVGVMQQVKVQGLGEDERTTEIYVPLMQNTWLWTAVAIRTAGDPKAFIAAAKAAIAKVDKNLPATHVRTMEEVAAESVTQPRFRAELMSAFAGLALILAAVGVFGVLAFSVAQRTREFGIRMALGARFEDVLRLVIAGGLKMTAAGTLIGLAGAAALTRYLASLLFGVKPLDAVTFLAAPAVLAAVALVACTIPAIRAARVSPAEALRQD